MSGTAWRLASALVALGAGVALAVATRHGVGTSTDSVAYLVSAGTLRQEWRLLVPGDAGDLVPLTRFPPLYPALLAALAAFTGSEAGAARLAGVLLLSLNVWLLSRVAGRGAHAAAGFVAAIFAAAALPLLEPHAWAWSEPVFLAAFLGLVLALDRALRTGARGAWAFACACVALLVLTRYAAVALAGGASLAVLLWAPARPRVRLAVAGAIAAAAVLPLMLWLLLSGAAGDRAAGRSPAFHPPGAAELLELARTFAAWLLPVPLPVVAALAVAAAVCLALVATALYARPRPGPYRMSALLLLLATSYVGFILLSYTFFDADIPFDDRILLPVFCALLIVAARAGARLLESRRRHHVLVIPVMVAALLLALHAARSARFLQRLHTDGLGYATRQWRESETVAWVRRHAGAHEIVSNYADVLVLHTGVRAAWLPWQGDPNRAVAFDPQYPAEIERLVRRVVEEDARIVLFRAPRRLLPDSAELAGLRGLDVQEVLADGIVLGPDRSVGDGS